MIAVSTNLDTATMSEMARGGIPRSWKKNGWSLWHLWMSLVMVALGVLATFDAWKDIWQIVWVDLTTQQDEYSHILLVPIVAAWLVWVRGGRFRHCRPRSTFVGPLIMLFGWALYWIGDNYYVLALWHAGAVVVAAGGLYTVLGMDVIFMFLPAMLLLAFLVPVPGRVRLAVALPLQGISTQVTQFVCELLGMTVLRSGNQLTVNGAALEVAEACNGMRMVFALVLVSFAFAFGTPLRWWVRLIIVALSPISAIFCNVVRLVATALVYGTFKQSTAQSFHDISGWCMLPISFLLLMGIIRALRWAMVPVNRYVLAYD